MIAFSKADKIKAYRLLSPQEKNTVFSQTVGEKIDLISMKYGLDPAKSKRFKYSLGLFLLGLITKNDIPQVINERLPELPNNEVMEDIKSIFFPEVEKVIREYKPDPEEEEPNAKDEPLTEEQKQMDAQLESEPEEVSSEEEGIDREDLLKAIEDPEEKNLQKSAAASQDKYREPIETPKPVSTGNPVEDRLKGIVFTPKETKQVVVEAPKPQPLPSKPVAKPNTSIPPLQQSVPKYQGNDPYREPLS